MTKTDWAVVGLNVFALFAAVVGLTAQHTDPMSMALLITIVTALVTGGWVLRRSNRAPAPIRSSEATDLSVHEILDLDARLEVLERAQADAADAARWRALVESGQVTGPTADAPVSAAGSTGAALRNGQ